MGLARYVLDAVVLEGRSPTENRAAPPDLAELVVPAPGAVPGGWLRGPRTPIPATAQVAW